ncbi:MAG: restriction endonuclease subunit S [Candidatus Electrothrix sp. AR3]|nr:restriction endonuclease subunit S [Candidatus Electrothrix sp. AR3]
MSGAEWIGEVPEGWKIVRLKDLGFLQNGISKSGDYFGHGFPFISYGNVYNNTLSSEKIKTFANSTPEDQQAYSCKKGDVFFTRTSETIEEIGFSATCLKTIPKSVFSGFVIRFRPTTKALVEDFSKFYFSANILRGFFSKEISLVTRASLSQGLLNKLSVALPPLPEQTAIAAYLDNKIAQIDRKIDLLSQKATQYGKLKQSLINETITCGLDKSVPMKDSGVAWIGEVPEHWKMKRLEDFSFVIDPQPDHRAPAHAEGDGYPYIGIRDLNNDGSLNFETARKVELAAVEKQEQSFSVVSGDILFCKVGTLGEPRIIIPKGRFALSATLVLIKVKREVSNNFLKYSLDSSCVLDQINHYGSGSTRPALGIKQIRKFFFPAPSLLEQKAIAAYLDEKTTQIDQITTTINNQINKLKELRKALINDVVTGKIKVSAP